MTILKFNSGSAARGFALFSETTSQFASATGSLDLLPVPSDKSAIQSVTPSQVYEWEGLGPNAVLTGATEERIIREIRGQRFLVFSETLRIFFLCSE